MADDTTSEGGNQSGVERGAAWGDTYCFGCSTRNHEGLHLEFTDGPDGTGTAEFTPRAEHEGPPGHFHGGLSATVLDEAMGWCAHESEGDRWVTGTLEVRYRKPLPIDGGKYRVEVETLKTSGRRKKLAARILLRDGTVAVEGECVYVSVV